ncbi:unnamed protein product, partial [marine sediment metagenome]
MPTRRAVSHSQEPLQPRGRFVVAVVLPVLVVAAGIVGYRNSFDGVFLLDDHRSIANNERIRDLGAVGTLLSGRRPVLDLSLAVNHALGELEVSPPGRADLGGYHAFNLLVHLLAALTLYGV